MTYLSKTEAQNMLIGLGAQPDTAWDFLEEARTDGMTGDVVPGYHVTCYAADAWDGYAVVGPDGPLGRDGRPSGRR